MQPSETARQKRGPKPKLEHSEQLLDQIRALGRIQATVEEAASVLRCSERTLQVFFADHSDAKEAHEEGKNEGRASLRRKQFAMAESNASMAIWLGKQYLGQKDSHVIGGDPYSPIKHVVEVIFGRGSEGDQEQG